MIRQSKTYPERSRRIENPKSESEGSTERAGQSGSSDSVIYKYDRQSKFQTFHILVRSGRMIQRESKRR